MSSRQYPSTLPSRYESSKLSETTRRWNGDLGRRVREWSPQVLPGVPPEAIMGFASNGSANGDPGLTPAHADFHEIGYFGIEGGPYNIPAPNRNTSQPNSWYRLHNDPRVRQMLGRDATMVPWPVRNEGTSQASADIPIDDQIAIGLANVADDIRRMRGSVPAEVRPSSESSLWAVALGFMGWSAGTGASSGHIRRYAAQLAGVPESERWPTLLRLVAADRSLPRTSRHNNPAWTVLRTQQKLRVARGLAISLGRDASWYAVDDGAEDAIARWVDAQTPAAEYTGSIMAVGEDGIPLTPILIVLGALSIAGVVIYQARRNRG